MEREFNFTDGTPGETGASTDLKQFHLLSSEPAVAGGLWCFAPLPGFSFLFLNPVYLLFAGLFANCIAIGIYLMELSCCNRSVLGWNCSWVENRS
ncbi:MAG: hypothetical protein AAES65_01645 [Candidatus Thiodiazotropha sp. (ex. Lucinoma kazani)]